MPKRDHFRRSLHRKYQKRRFQNPYFQKKNTLSLKAGLAIGIIIVGVFFLCWFLFASPVFKITNATAQGTETLTPQEIEEVSWGYLHSRSWLIFHHTNRFLFDKEELFEELNNSFTFETIEAEINKHTLAITVKEKASHLLWDDGEQVLIVDLAGSISRYLTNQEKAWLESRYLEKAEPPTREQDQFDRLPIFEDLNEIPTDIGNQVLTEEEITSVLLLHQGLETLGIPFKTTQIDRLSGKWMGVMTNAGYRILFDAYGNIGEQLEHLDIVLKEHIQEDVSVEYIDVRFGDHVYFK